MSPAQDVFELGTLKKKKKKKSWLRHISCHLPLFKEMNVGFFAEYYMTDFFCMQNSLYLDGLYVYDDSSCLLL